MANQTNNNPLMQEFNQNLEVVYVDDEEQNTFVFNRQFGDKYNLKLFHKPLEAHDYIKNNEKVAVVITDQSMPNMSGLELANNVWVTCPYIQFIMITGNPENDDQLMYKSLKGRKFYDFISKPLNFEKNFNEYDNIIRNCIHQFCLNTLKHRYNEGMAILISRLVDEHDEYNHSHVSNVSNFCCWFAQEALNFNNEEIEVLKLAAVLHDIGKVQVSPKNLVADRGLNTNMIQNILNKHTQNGLALTSDIPYFNQLVELGAYHHNWHDGSHLFHGKKGEDIPLAAKIIAIWNHFDIVQSTKTYDPDNSTKNYQEAIEDLKAKSGTQFDPELVTSMVNFLNNHPEIAKFYKNQRNNPKEWASFFQDKQWGYGLRKAG